MADPGAQITTAIQAIRLAANADLIISRSAVLEIERQVGLITSLTQSPEIEREGSYLMSRALGRHTDTGQQSPLVLDARLHGAIARFEHVLRRLGFLPPEPAPSPESGNASRPE